MAIKFVAVKCPACGANLDIEDGRKQIFCSYCGTKIIVDNENEYIYRNIDEASIKKTEAETMLRLKELEMKEKEDERNRKGHKRAYIIAVIFIAIGLIISLLGEFEGMFAVIIGVLIAEITFVSQYDKKKKATRLVSQDKIQISEKMESYSGKNYTSIVGLYRAAGFTNVTAVPLNDLNIFSFNKNGLVDDIAINGDNDFEEGDVFPKSAYVTITYHSTQ